MKIAIPPRRRFWAIILNSAVFLIAFVLLLSGAYPAWQGFFVAIMLLDVFAVGSVIVGHRLSR